METLTETVLLLAAVDGGGRLGDGISAVPAEVPRTRRAREGGSRAV